ncbi:MAG: hypothetical protein GY696_02200 [Gammaproteobacteria bacterium]|nr:hypothetical protein [Gammaproteobacteria bacterium]
MPILTYGAAAFAAMAFVHWRALQIVQNTALRAAYRARRNTRLAVLHQQASITTVRARSLSLGKAFLLKALQEQPLIRELNDNSTYYRNRHLQRTVWKPTPQEVLLD